MYIINVLFFHLNIATHKGFTADSFTIDSGGITFFNGDIPKRFLFDNFRQIDIKRYDNLEEVTKVFGNDYPVYDDVW